jgi:ABC-2 type transport system permease protein
MLDASAEVNVVAHPTDLQLAEKLLKDSKVSGVLFIPEGFEKQLLKGQQADVFALCRMRPIF